MARKKGVKGSGMQPRKRSDGRWEARMTLGLDESTGKMIVKSVYGKTATECAQKLHALAAKVGNGTYVEPVRMTVAEWLDIWCAEYLGDVKASTASQYGSYVANHLKPVLGRIKLAQLRPHAIQAFYNQRLKSTTASRGLSAKTIKNLHGILHSALKQAMLLGYIPSNPADACVLPRIAPQEVSFLEESEIQSFLAAIAGHPFENVYKVDLFTGMRQGEILGLTWDCVDFDSGIIVIEKQLQKERHKGSGEYKLLSCKNDRVRRIRPAAFVMDVLREQHSFQMEQQQKAGEHWNNPWNLVFTNETGRYLCAFTVYKNFKKVMASIALPATRFHDLRHTYAMLSLQNGDDVKTVQHNVGHASASFTLDVYGHVSQRMQQESADRMQRFFETLAIPSATVSGQISGHLRPEIEKIPESAMLSGISTGGAGGIRSNHSMPKKRKGSK